MTLIRKIKGFKGLQRAEVIVHFTSDDLGETLSLASGNTQITVPYSQIEKMVERERAKGYTKGHDIIYEETSGGEHENR